MHERTVEPTCIVFPEISAGEPGRTRTPLLGYRRVLASFCARPASLSSFNKLPSPRGGKLGFCLQKASSQWGPPWARLMK